jgi:hypothetical protein
MPKHPVRRYGPPIGALASLLAWARVRFLPPLSFWRTCEGAHSRLSAGLWKLPGCGQVLSASRRLPVDSWQRTRQASPVTPPADHLPTGKTDLATALGQLLRSCPQFPQPRRNHLYLLIFGLDLSFSGTHVTGSACGMPKSNCRRCKKVIDVKQRQSNGEGHGVISVCRAARGASCLRF